MLLYKSKLDPPLDCSSASAVGWLKEGVGERESVVGGDPMDLGD